MKNIIKYGITGLMAAMAAIGCSDWLRPERVIVQHPEDQSPIVRDDAYYEALREYKQQKNRKLAFGWYGSWTGSGASRQSKVSSAPDSMDIISIWSQWHSLTPEQIADKEFVQKVKGTKVTYTIFLHDIPEEFKDWEGNAEHGITDEVIERFAKAYCKDSMDRYQYDGIDIDYEPGYAGHDTPLLINNADATPPELFHKTIKEMSKYVGPKSGTGRLFIIDGVPYAVKGEYVDLFDYGIVQAYNSNGYTDLQTRFDNADKAGWKPEKYIFAENFESFWKDGGVSHQTRDGETVNSLLGMAKFNPTQGYCAGFGAYHMEYEYAHADMPYKWMRRAIQDVNPAGGAIATELNGTESETVIYIDETDPASAVVSAPVGLVYARPVPENLSFSLTLDNTLVEKYSEESGLEFAAIDPGRVSLPPVITEKNAMSSELAYVEVDMTGLEPGFYCLPVRVNIPEGSICQVKDGAELVKYIKFTVYYDYIDTYATEVKGTKISPAEGWTINCYQGTGDSGATGVWNCDSDQQKAAMFDGNLDANCWYANSADFSWGYGGNFKVTLDKEYELSGFRWNIYYIDCNPSIEDILVSTDGQEWASLLNGKSFVPKYNGNWKIFKFKKTAKARYIRVVVGPLAKDGYTSMNEIEFFTPAN